MKAVRACPHRYLFVELLEPRLPTGDLLLGGLALAAVDALGEVNDLAPVREAHIRPLEAVTPTLHRIAASDDMSQAEVSIRKSVQSAGAVPELERGEKSQTVTTSLNTLDLVSNAPQAVMHAAPAPSRFHAVNGDLPTGLIHDTVSTAPLSRRPEQIEDMPAADALLPKNRPQLRGRPAEVRRGPYVSVQVNVDENGLNIVGDAANEPSIAITNRVVKNIGLSRALGPGTEAASEGGQDFRVTQPQVHRLQHVVIGWRQFDTVASNFRQAGYNRSYDGGRHWKTAGVLQPGVWRSDPVLASSRDGVIYYSSLRSNFAGDVFRTDDGGATWSAPQFAYGGDKIWLTVDNTGGMGDGHLYQSWNIAGNDYYPNLFNRSVDGGVNWSFPTSIPQRPVFGTLDVGSDGALYVVGIPDQTTNQMVVAKSTNAQDPLVTPTFTSVNVSMGGSMVIGDGPNPGGLLGQAWIAVDRSGGPTNNYIYVLCSLNPSGSDPMDVRFIRSTDGGLTWSAPLRINDDPAGNNAWQWFGTMSVAPNGRIDAVWNDTRHSLSDNSISEVYYAYSLDGGATFSKNIPLTPAWDSHVGWPNQNKIGDYYHMVSENHSAALAYAATFNGEQDVYFLRIGDCNNNFVHDGVDISSSHSQDGDDNLIPDECE